MNRLLAIALLLLTALPSFAVTRTAVSTTAGAWSNAASWDTGVPADTDAFIIPDGKSITFDADQSAMGTGMAASQINGTGRLYVTQTPGTYTMKLAGTISGTGAILWHGATSADPLPDNVIVNVTSTYNGSLVTLTGPCVFRCKDPAVPVATCKSANGIGDTKIYLNETLDTVWANGRYVRVDDVAGAVESEEFTISNTGVDGGGQYITLSAGLAAAKLINATVTLTQRNIFFNGNSGASQYCFNGVHDSTLNCGIRAFNRGQNGCYSITWSGGSISGCTYVQNGCYSFAWSGGSISGCTYGQNLCYSFAWSGGSISGCTTGQYNCYSITMSGGSISGCTYGQYNCYSITMSGGSISGCTNSQRFCHAIIARNATLTSNTSNIRASVGLYDNCTFTGGTRYQDSNELYLLPWNYTQCTNDGGVSGAFSARSIGGTTTHDLVTYPPGHTLAYTHACEDASYPCFRQDEVYLNPGERATWTLHYKLSATAWATDPKFEIINKFQDPLASAGSALATVTCSDADTDWHTTTITYRNTATTPIQVYIRATAQDAAKILYERMDRAVITAIGSNP